MAFDKSFIKNQAKLKNWPFTDLFDECNQKSKLEATKSAGITHKGSSYNICSQYLSPLASCNDGSSLIFWLNYFDCIISLIYTTKHSTNYAHYKKKHEQELCRALKNIIIILYSRRTNLRNISIKQIIWNCSPFRINIFT